MNEVTRIHLGRQPFTISVDARKALQTYLDAIKKQVSGSSADVIKEVELRMAELLTERGIKGEKVVLPEDIQFLKDQLGAPNDFREEEEDETPTDTEEQPTKRLFRDTEKGMVAGVAMGLANYFGVDVWIVRIIFILAIVTGGWGIPIYIILWLLVPVAMTSSDRLQMHGKPVTVDSLKEIVDRTGVSKSTTRAVSAISETINMGFKILLQIIGVGFILAALAGLFALLFSGAYMALHNGKLFQEDFFPVAGSEVLLLVIVMVLAALLATLLLLIGVSLVRRKWPIPGWATGAILGTFFVGLAVGSALAADAVPRVRDRYQAAQHSVTQPVEPFDSVNVKPYTAGFRYERSDTYAITIHYIGNPDISTVKTKVVDKNLEIDAQELTDSAKCNMFCLFHSYNLQITVHSPDLKFPEGIPDSSIYNLPDNYHESPPN